MNEAKEKYGSDSHSCSIAQKEDFIEVEASVDWAKKACETRLNDLAQKRSNARTVEEMDKTTNSIRETKKERNAFNKRDKKSGRSRALAIAYLIIGMEDDMVTDLSKPALAVQVVKNEWLFFGLANE